MEKIFAKTTKCPRNGAQMDRSSVYGVHHISLDTLKTSVTPLSQTFWGDWLSGSKAFVAQGLPHIPVLGERASGMEVGVSPICTSISEREEDT